MMFIDDSKEVGLPRASRENLPARIPTVQQAIANVSNSYQAELVARVQMRHSVIDQEPNPIEVPSEVHEPTTQPIPAQSILSDEQGMNNQEYVERLYQQAMDSYQYEGQEVEPTLRALQPVKHEPEINPDNIIKLEEARRLIDESQAA